MAYNPVLRWNKSPASPSVTAYQVAWTRNGSPLGNVSVAQSGFLDGSLYVTAVSNISPAVTLLGGDVVSATIIAFDAVNNLSSTPVTTANLVIPNDPPQPPANVALTLS